MPNTLSQIEAAINTTLAILDTYEGMASLYDGEAEYPAHIFDRIDELQAEIAQLDASYNHELLVLEGAV